MAEFGINIDTVYQTVQALANKEQRGYVTPQEFNLFANQAQLDIFEQYFYELNALIAERPEDNEIGNSVSMLRQKLKPWTFAQDHYDEIPAGARVGRIWVGHGDQMIQPREISPNEWQDLNASKWHKLGNAKEGFYWREPTAFPNGQQQIHIKGGQGKIEFVEGRPALVYWGYVIVNEKPMYDPSQSKHFTLHASEQPDLVIKILELAGVSIEDQSLVQYANSSDQNNKADERI